MHATDHRLMDLRRANDLLRRTGLTGNLMWKRGFQVLDARLQAVLVQQMREHPEYDAVRDPQGEHAAGFARLGEHILVWQMLYYDGRRPGFEGRSPDPSNPHVTRRVLLLDYAHDPAARRG